MRNEFLDSINEIHEEMKSLTKAGSCGEYAGQAEYEDTVLIVDSVLKSPIVGSLLHLFWQRTSDACPLECTEAENQELEFKKWVNTITFNSIIKYLNEKEKYKYCMPDDINSKEEHEEYLKAIGYKK